MAIFWKVIKYKLKFRSYYEILYFAFMVLRPAFSNGRYYLISSIALSTVKILNMLLYYEPVFIKQCYWELERQLIESNHFKHEEEDKKGRGRYGRANPHLPYWGVNRYWLSNKSRNGILETATKRTKTRKVNRLCLYMIGPGTVKGAFLVRLYYLACYNA